MATPKIALFAGCDLRDYKYGGPVKAILGQLRAIASRYELHVFSHKNENGEKVTLAPDYFPKEARVAFLPQSQRSLMALSRSLKELQPDIYYLNSFFQGDTRRVLLLHWLGLIPRRPVLVAPHGELSPGSLRIKAWKKYPYLVLFYLLGMHRSLYWHACSERETMQIGHSLFSPPPERIFTASNFQEAMPAAASHPQKKRGEAKITFIARISRSKNLSYALKRLAEVKPGCIIHFDVYGIEEDKAYLETCLKQMASLPAHVVAQYKGELTSAQVPEALSHYHFYFLPTRSENFGYSILEALCCGLPVLISDQTPFAVETAQAGWAPGLSDRNAFTRALEASVAMDEERYLQMRANALAMAVQFTDTARIAQEHLTMFDALGPDGL